MTSIGSLIAKSVKRSSLFIYAFISLLVALWPLLQLIAIRNFREFVFIHGSSHGFYQIFFFILITTAPYCILIGFILPYALKVLNDNSYNFESGDLYVTDSIGDILGGALFSFVLVYWLKPFNAIALTSSLLIAVSLWLLIMKKKRLFFLTALLFVGIFYLFALNKGYELSTLSKQYGDIVRYLETPYGRIVISKEGPQHTFWESGMPFYSDANIVRSEEKIHFPLSQLDRVGNVLLISGGLGETLKEIMKHNPDHIDYVELDPYLTGVAEDLGFLRKGPLLSIINSDGRHYVEKTDKKYDAIIIDLPDPDTFQINRFYTSQFFQSCKGILREGGVLSFGMSYSQNYISDIRKSKLSIINNTLKAHFENAMVIPGGEAYFICRDGQLWDDVPSRLKKKGIGTSYIEGFFYGNVTTDRMKILRESLDADEFINTDFEPRIMNVVFKEWFIRYGGSPKYFLIILSIVTIIYLVLVKKEEYILFSTGLVTMGVEMMIIFVFQVMYGYIYLKVGAIITVFLLGLLPGSIMGKIQRDRKWRQLILSEIFLLGLLVIFYVWINFSKGAPHQLFFLAYCFIFSFFCGYQFPVATNIIGEKRSPTAGCIAADLSGAALGTIITGTLLIPMGGIQSAIIFLILIKVSSNMIIIFGKP